MLKTLRQIAIDRDRHRAAADSRTTACACARPCRSASAPCSAGRSASVTSTPAPATAASSKSTRSTIRSTTSKGLGIRFVASPRHADLLLVTGPVSKHMEVALRRTYEATPDPKLVVALGDCGCTGGMFGESYASRGRVSNVIPVDVAVPGCPPSPTRILQGILTALGHSSGKKTPNPPSAHAGGTELLPG